MFAYQYLFISEEPSGESEGSVTVLLREMTAEEVRLMLFTLGTILL